MMRFLKVAAALWLAPALFAQHPIMQIQVAGAQRLPAAAVIAASGLRVGQTVNHAQLDAAAQKLADTGLFSSVSYAYDPKTAGGVTGYALTLQVSEIASRSTLELDIPGVTRNNCGNNSNPPTGCWTRRCRITNALRRIINAPLKPRSGN